MLNFEEELNKLLSRETGRLPQYEFAELAAAGQQLLAELNKKQTEVSLQIEEIYDVVKEQDTRVFREAAEAEKTRANQLVFTAIDLADLLEDFCSYARQSGSEELKHQAAVLWENAGAILAGRGIFRLGEEGQPLNPQIHTVKASAESPFPREQVIQVLRSGYLYQNALVRKAAVVVSRGQEEWNVGSGDQDTEDREDEGEGENQDNQDYQEDESIETREQDENQEQNEGEQDE
jgi:molecular chaperone GrpE (heat shock protein)